MKKTYLVLLCDSYPITAGEFFIDDEMRVIADRFERIYVLTPEQKTNKLNRYITDNMVVIRYNSKILLSNKLKAIPIMLTPMFIEELLLALFRYKIEFSIMLLKIMFMDLVRSNMIISNLRQFKLDYKICDDDTVYYSYWHDYKALALARISKKSKSVKTIARSHNSDLFVERQLLNYLPYKTFITKNLTKTISISQKGKQYFENHFKIKTPDKIIVSRLGKSNKRMPIVSKITIDEFVICSCSHFNKMKRVHLIVEILCELKNLNIKWIHFGWGPEEQFVLNKIKTNYSNMNFQFMGKVNNETILNYYSKNYIDLFINVSESEGIPVSIMEAMSAGIPVLATNVGGTSEIVNNQTGFLVDKDFNPKEVAKIINDYLNLPFEEHLARRRNAYGFWKENFDAHENYIKFAEHLLNND